MIFSPKNEHGQLVYANHSFLGHVEAKNLLTSLLFIDYIDTDHFLEIGKIISAKILFNNLDTGRQKLIRFNMKFRH